MDDGRAMFDNDRLAERFEADRPRLQALARRMLGTAADAEDAVQEAWLRLARSDAARVENLGGWLTTVVTRVCLDTLRSRRRDLPRGADDLPGVADPEQEAVLGESVGLALVLVLDTLPPAERVAFVLHDMFGLPFAEIGGILSRSPAAARQLASRGRRRVRRAGTAGSDVGERRRLVDAFLAASRRGDLRELIALLAPEVVLRADAAAVRMGAMAELRGPAAVAGTFAGRAQGARTALVAGEPGAVWITGDRPRVVFRFSAGAGRITAIDMVADREVLDRLEIVTLSPA